MQERYTMEDLSRLEFSLPNINACLCDMQMMQTMILLVLTRFLVSGTAGGIGSSINALESNTHKLVYPNTNFTSEACLKITDTKPVQYLAHSLISKVNW